MLLRMRLAKCMFAVQRSPFKAPLLFDLPALPPPFPPRALRPGLSAWQRIASHQQSCFTPATTWQHWRWAQLQWDTESPVLHTCPEDNKDLDLQLYAHITRKLFNSLAKLAYRSRKSTLSSSSLYKINIS